MLVVHPVDAPGQYAVQFAACWTPFPFESHHHLAWHQQALPVAHRILVVVLVVVVAVAVAAVAVVVRQNLPPVFVQSCQRVLQAGLECSRNHHRQRTDILNLQEQ
jgi:hypothetical protein